MRWGGRLVIFFYILCKFSGIFSSTLPVCKIVQSVSCDLVDAVKRIETILNELIIFGENIDHTFSKKKSALVLKSVDDQENVKMSRIIASPPTKSYEYCLLIVLKHIFV